jgi:hypothetical protein
MHLLIRSRECVVDAKAIAVPTDDLAAIAPARVCGQSILEGAIFIPLHRRARRVAAEEVGDLGDRPILLPVGQPGAFFWDKSRRDAGAIKKRLVPYRK